ncbi:hypothetical protein GCM10023174_25260 [Chelativorans composti]
MAEEMPGALADSGPGALGVMAHEHALPFVRRLVLLRDMLPAESCDDGVDPVAVLPVIVVVPQDQELAPSQKEKSPMT